MYDYTKLDPQKCEFVSIGAEEEIKKERRIFVEVDNISMVVFNIGDEYYAVEDICPHDYGPLGDGDLEDEFVVVCPRHGARFDVRTGKVVTLPAATDIAVYPTRVVDGQIEVGLPLEE